MPDTFIPLDSLHTQLPSYSLSARWKTELLSASIAHTLDRVNVLGDDTYGHTGCVNALSWAQDGELLLSGGDDTTVRLWRLDQSNTEQAYPFVCDAVIQTGHRSNIFNAQLLPYSTRIATVARDTTVRICDAREGLRETVRGRDAVYSAREVDARVLKCHERAVKRIVTENSPGLFLTVSEDGTVRQHDLRTHHSCSGRSNCPPPLVKVNFDLSTIALSPLTPYQFVVAGESPYGYLFDRRQTGRHLKEEWGVPPETDGMVTCVRRFGRAPDASDKKSEYTGRSHITGARMATTNGHEVLLSYSSDAVYLYSTRDDPEDTISKTDTLLRPNKKAKATESSDAESSNAPGSAISDTLMEEDIEHFLDADDPATSTAAEDGQSGTHEEEESEDENEETWAHNFFPGVPTVLPRAKFAGACNVETVKDVNFLGPRDEYITSGSDDGHFFIWRKSDGKLHDILEGDGQVVNVIEGHPHLPLVAVSGIDTTVKLFAPCRGESSFSRMKNAEDIVKRNSEASAHRLDLSHILMYAQVARQAGIRWDEEQCNHQ